MANPQLRRRPARPLDGSDSGTDASDALDDRTAAARREDVRRARVERLDPALAPTLRRRKSLVDREMPTSSAVASASLRSKTGSRRHRHAESGHRSGRRREEVVEERGGSYVYGPPPTGERLKRSSGTVRETRRLGRDGDSEGSDDHVRSSRVARSERERPKERKIRVVYLSKEEMKNMPLKERRPRVERKLSDRSRTSEEVVHRSRAQHSRHNSMPEPVASPPKRMISIRQVDNRPSLRRSNTTSSQIPSSRALAPNTSIRRNSLFGGFFSPTAQPPKEPERLVECLTCLSDDIPRSKSAKLSCGHRMCQPCLKRIFRLSVTDPQHMPPKCCTADHIPLKHVEKLFNNEFKKTWNKKFHEYSTKDRIYCPARRCGEWIKPKDIHKEDGKKYGKCGRCKTKVCCACNGKWHGSRECPKDEETNRLLETAKNEGWQRCYSCRTMVELKEGCNHMTCRCTAEFCMICGLKWKSCDCPWFNFEAVENDRLNHMNPIDPYPHPELLPARRDIVIEEVNHPRRIRRNRPATYHEEMDGRRRQEREDANLARRMQRLRTEDHEDDYQGGIGDIHGIGNAAGHFMNQDYIRAAQNILTGDLGAANAAANYVLGVNNGRGFQDRYPAQQQEQPMLRRRAPSVRNVTGERILVPGRTRRDYVSEAAVHAPAPPPPAPVRRNSTRERSREPTLSALAGLSGRQRGNNRVSMWRNFVDPGAPEEGVISIEGGYV